MLVAICNGSSANFVGSIYNPITGVGLKNLQSLKRNHMAMSEKQ